MNLDDETFLSAFLDDELDSADRTAVAWSIETSPPLAFRLRDLAATRDLVAGLGRPVAPVDLGPGLVAHLATARRPARSRAASRLVAMTFAGGMIALAASLLAAMFFVYRATHDLDRPGPAVAVPEANLAKTPSVGPTLAEASVVGPPPLLGRATSPIPVVSPPAEAVARAPEFRFDPGSMAREQADRDKIAGMLVRRDVHRILIVTDVIDAGERIRTLIQRDVRKHPDFGRITVSEGIVIDPRHPGEADVFTLVMDGREYEPFVGKLAKAFPRTDVVVETRTDPLLLTQLGEVGHAMVLPGLSPNSPALPLVLADNSDLTADYRSNQNSGSGSFVMPDMDSFGLDGHPIIQDPDGDAPRGAPTRFPTSPDPATYLVWVTRPAARR